MDGAGNVILSELNQTQEDRFQKFSLFHGYFGLSDMHGSFGITTVFKKLVRDSRGIFQEAENRMQWYI
jgi:hypothetical protein